MTLAYKPELIDAIKALPHHRDMQHCGAIFAVSPFDIYATCPHCGQQIKVRSCAAVAELEDVFDAVFEWMLHEDGDDLARQRQKAIRDDLDE
jgi:predicted  nucleic acid-binding Zn-ribbon protein